MDNSVTFKETVEMFINSAMSDIINEVETSKFNIIFPNKDFDLFYNIMNSPYEKKGHSISNIKKEDLEKININNQNDTNCPTIYVKNTTEFFQYLTDLTNNLYNLYSLYDLKISCKDLLNWVLRRIWLRMGVEDFNNVEKFLFKELEFIKNSLFIDYRLETKIKEFYGYDVKVKNELGTTWDEASNKITFKIYDENYNYHSLPHIFYGIMNDTCYIYGIQNDFYKNKISKVERLLYKLNKDIENPNIHPGFVYSLMLFIEILKDKNIKNIKVPTLQVLSYRYHELLSNYEKEKFAKKWDLESLKKLENLKGDKLKRELNRYELDKKWYNHIVDKEDLISRNKVENLINLILRVISTDEELTLVNDIDISDVLDIKIKKM